MEPLQTTTTLGKPKHKKPTKQNTNSQKGESMYNQGLHL